MPLHGSDGGCVFPCRVGDNRGSKLGILPPHPQGGEILLMRLKSWGEGTKTTQIALHGGPELSVFHYWVCRTYILNHSQAKEQRHHSPYQRKTWKTKIFRSTAVWIVSKSQKQQRVTEV